MAVHDSKVWLCARAQMDKLSLRTFCVIEPLAATSVRHKIHRQLLRCIQAMHDTKCCNVTSTVHPYLSSAHTRIHIHSCSSSTGMAVQTTAQIL